MNPSLRGSPSDDRSNLIYSKWDCSPALPLCFAPGTLRSGGRCQGRRDPERASGQASARLAMTNTINKRTDGCYPSVSILLSGKERGMHPSSFGERLDALRKAELTSVGHPGPTFC